MAAVVLTGAGAYALTAGEPAPPAQSGTARVDRGDVATAVATTGSLEPAQTRTLGFATDGTVTVVGVRAGDQVETGQVLAEIDATEARERVDDAREALAEAEDALAEAEAALDGGSGTCAVSATGTAAVVPVALTGGTTPTPGPNPTASPSPSPSGQPSTSPSPSRSVVPPAPSQPSRSSPPASPGSTARPGGGSVPGGGASPDCGGARGADAVLAARQRVTSAELALAEAEDQLAGTKITAPIGGKVLSVAGAVGAEVTARQTFVSLADVAGMQVSADFPEADAGHLAAGLSATVTLANRPGEEFAARVVRVSPVGAVDGDMVRYGAVFAFEEVPTDLLVGQSASIRVRTSEVTGVLRVPSTAVRGDGTVLVRTAAGDETRAVQVGLRGDQHTEIKSGLIEGDEIVIAGA
ncbi:efflux RND transporter periplasmic adaptor subunit [Phytohabitans kaempferiae]|uniref:Efflux RND transporter periplasmic adaptor subunit n=1 Tax=Phytohabitans kaempferiae TaxID=1620943 RepID=A0ABV6LWT7_9ACTN